MRKYIKQTGMFLLIALLLAFAFDLAISKGLRKTERSNFFTMNALMNQTLDADLLVLGSSRAQCAFHPTILDTILHVNSWNLGVSGQPFGISYLRWQLYKRNNNSPKMIIINVDYGELGMVTNGFEKEQYYPYIMDSLVKPYLDLYGFKWAEKYIPLFRYRGDYKLMSIGLVELFQIHHFTEGSDVKGYFNCNEPWNGDSFQDMLRQGHIKSSCQPQAIELLEDLLKQAKKEGTLAVFVYAPIYKQLKQNLDEQESMNAYHKLSEKYDVPYLDYSEMWFCSDTNYFYNANHVNAKGAKLFSIELAHAIDSLGDVNKTK